MEKDTLSTLNEQNAYENKKKLTVFLTEFISVWDSLAASELDIWNGMENASNDSKCRSVLGT